MFAYLFNIELCIFLLKLIIIITYKRFIIPYYNKNNKIKLLYVEDENLSREYGIYYLKRFFSNIYEADSAELGFELYLKHKPKIIITDIKMSGDNGIEMIKKIRQIDEECQIIVLSAFLDTKYLMDAIELNLVKYLTKPINIKELDEAINKCIDTLNKKPDLNIINFSNNCVYNLENKTLEFKGKSIDLSSKEIDFLDLICKNKNRIISYKEIQNKIWYEDAMSENALRIFIAKLRKKLPQHLIKNISKIGYKLEINP